MSCTPPFCCDKLLASSSPIALQTASDHVLILCMFHIRPFSIWSSQRCHAAGRMKDYWIFIFFTEMAKTRSHNPKRSSRFERWCREKRSQAQFFFKTIGVEDERSFNMLQIARSHRLSAGGLQQERLNVVPTQRWLGIAIEDDIVKLLSGLPHVYTLQISWISVTNKKLWCLLQVQSHCGLTRAGGLATSSDMQRPKNRKHSLFSRDLLFSNLIRCKGLGLNSRQDDLPDQVMNYHCVFSCWLLQ